MIIAGAIQGAGRDRATGLLATWARSAADTKTPLRDAALRLVGRHGFAGSSIRAIPPKSDDQRESARTDVLGHVETFLRAASRATPRPRATRAAQPLVPGKADSLDHDPASTLLKGEPEWQKEYGPPPTRSLIAVSGTNAHYRSPFAAGQRAGILAG
ncbi:hypothetical protein GCM10028833_37590 [Glycomyces tarimensis]